MAYSRVSFRSQLGWDTMLFEETDVTAMSILSKQCLWGLGDSSPPYFGFSLFGNILGMGHLYITPFSLSRVTFGGQYVWIKDKYYCWGARYSFDSQAAIPSPLPAFAPWALCIRSSWPTLIPMVFSFPVVTDETLSFIQKSRRLLVVLSPNYVLQGTQALLELKAGVENMASRGNINVILVQYKAVKDMKVKELKRAKTVLTVIKWKGEKSKYPQGRFWKQLQVAMPVKKSSRWSSSDKQGLSYSSLKNVWKGKQRSEKNEWAHGGGDETPSSLPSCGFIDRKRTLSKPLIGKHPRDCVTGSLASQANLKVRVLFSTVCCQV